MQSEVARNMAAAERDTAEAQSSIADSETRRLEALAKTFQAGFQAGQ
jgi:hypothetical protein